MVKLLKPNYYPSILKQKSTYNQVKNFLSMALDYISNTLLNSQKEDFINVLSKIVM